MPIAKTPTVVCIFFNCLPRIPPAHRRFCAGGVDSTIASTSLTWMAQYLYGLGMRRPPSARFTSCEEKGKHVRHVKPMCFHPARVLHLSLSRTRERKKNTQRVFSKLKLSCRIKFVFLRRKTNPMRCF